MKTTKTGASVKEFLDNIRDETKRADAKALDRLIRRATGQKPKMWGTAIIGYGDTMLVYPNGKEVEWMAIGFSPRAATLTVYLGNIPKIGALLKKLGTHKTGKGCLYFKRIADVDTSVLEAILKRGYADALAA